MRMNGCMGTIIYLRRIEDYLKAIYGLTQAARAPHQ